VPLLAYVGENIKTFSIFAVCKETKFVV